jgi:hypothetical protein
LRLKFLTSGVTDGSLQLVEVLREAGFKVAGLVLVYKESLGILVDQADKAR